MSDAHLAFECGIIVVDLIHLGLESELNESLALLFSLLPALEQDYLTRSPLQLLLGLVVTLSNFALSIVLCLLIFDHFLLSADLPLQFSRGLLKVELLLQAQLRSCLELSVEVAALSRVRLLNCLRLSLQLTNLCNRLLVAYERRAAVTRVLLNRRWWRCSNLYLRER